MGCFLGCFKESKDPKRSNKRKKLLPAAKLSHDSKSIVFCSSSSTKDILLETEVATDNPIPKLRENLELGAVANVRKKVTFDLNVTTFDIATVHGDSNNFCEDHTFERNVNDQNNDKEEEKEKEEIANAVAHPPNDRYQNYDSSDDDGLYEEGENDEDEIDSVEDNGSGCVVEEESYDSYFSLPMESQVLHFQDVSSLKPTGEAATERELLVESKGNVRYRRKYINSVLNPVENFSHWKEVKFLTTSLKNTNKENINFDSESQTFIIPESTMKSKKPVSTNTNHDDLTKQELTVDASLSNWLISPINSRIEPQTSSSFLLNSPVSQEECPILGSLDMEVIRHSVRISSPRKSPSRSPEEIPIIGTGCGYWISTSEEGSPSSCCSSSASEKRGFQTPQANTERIKG